MSNPVRKGLAKLVFDVMFPIRQNIAANTSQIQDTYHKICERTYYDEFAEELLVLASEALKEG